MIEIKISNNTNGIPLKPRSKSEALEIIDALLCVDGLKRMTITCTPNQGLSVEGVGRSVKYPEQPCGICQSLCGAQNHSDVDAPTPQATPRFVERPRINKADLNAYIGLGACEMGYHNQKDGVIVICHGTVKLYTSWNDVEQLPYPIPQDVIKHLGTPKQVALRHFREWIEQGKPDMYVDPDAAFRPAHITDTKPKSGGDYENTTGSYE